MIGKQADWAGVLGAWPSAAIGPVGESAVAEQWIAWHRSWSGDAVALLLVNRAFSKEKNFHHYRTCCLFVQALCGRSFPLTVIASNFWMTSAIFSAFSALSALSAFSALSDVETGENKLRPLSWLTCSSAGESVRLALFRTSSNETFRGGETAAVPEYFQRTIFSATPSVQKTATCSKGW